MSTIWEMDNKTVLNLYNIIQMLIKANYELLSK